jgi:hypothetical protein
MGLSIVHAASVRKHDAAPMRRVDHLIRKAARSSWPYKPKRPDWRPEEKTTAEKLAEIAAKGPVEISQELQSLLVKDKTEAE